MEVVVARTGRVPLPREVRVAFWDGVRAGLGPEEAAVAAGAGRHAGRRWMAAAGGVKGNGPAAVSGRFLAGWEREEIAVGLAAGRPEQGPEPRPLSSCCCGKAKTGRRVCEAVDRVGRGRVPGATIEQCGRSTNLVVWLETNAE